MASTSSTPNTASAGVEAVNSLTYRPDHSMGADHLRKLSEVYRTICRRIQLCIMSYLAEFSLMRFL